MDSYLVVVGLLVVAQVLLDCKSVALECRSCLSFFSGVGRRGGDSVLSRFTFRIFTVT